MRASLHGTQYLRAGPTGVAHAMHVRIGVGGRAERSAAFIAFWYAHPHDREQHLPLLLDLPLMKDLPHARHERMAAAF